MPARRLDRLPEDLQAALDGSACLGAFAYDVPADQITLAPDLAIFLGLEPDKAIAGIGLRDALQGIQADDRLRIENLIHAASETRGAFEAELRTRLRHRGPGWLRLMGRCSPNPASGTVLARGLAFDLTERRLAAGTPAERAHRQANQLAEHVIAMQGLVAGLRNPPLSQLVEKVAIEIGFELARRLQAAEGGPRH